MEFDDDFDVRELDAVNMDFDAIKKAIFEVIKAVGEDPEREGLSNTPDRVSRMYAELLSGYNTDPEKIINGALFNINYDEMVLVRDIEFYWARPCGISPERESDRSFQDPAHCGYVRAPPAGAGKDDTPDRGSDPANAGTAWRGCRGRSGAYVFDDARREEAQCAHDDLCHARCLPRQPGDTTGIP